MRNDTNQTTTWPRFGWNLAALFLRGNLVDKFAKAFLGHARCESQKQCRVTLQTLVLFAIGLFRVTSMIRGVFCRLIDIVRVSVYCKFRDDGTS